MANTSSVENCTILAPSASAARARVAGGQGVDAVSAVGVRLAAVLIIKAGAVDDDIRAVGIRKGADFGGDSHIHFRHIGGRSAGIFRGQAVYTAPDQDGRWHR